MLTDGRTDDGRKVITIAYPEQSSGELKNVTKNNFRILKKQYAYLQTILKAPVKFEKDWPKNVGGVVGRRMVGVLMDDWTDGCSKFQRV